MSLTQEKFNDVVYLARQLYTAEMLHTEDHEMRSTKYRVVHDTLLQLIENDEQKLTPEEAEKKICHMIVSCREIRHFYKKGGNKKDFEDALNYRTEDFIENFNGFFKSSFSYTKEAKSESVISSMSFFLKPSLSETSKSTEDLMVFSTEIIDFNIIDPRIRILRATEALHSGYFFAKIEIPNDPIYAVLEKLKIHSGIVQIGQQYTQAGESKLRKNGVITMLFAKPEPDGFVQAPVPNDLPARFRK